MRSVPWVTRVAVAALSIAPAIGARAQDTPADVQDWLDRMNIAAEELNYRGSYVHAVDGNAEEFHIVHRNLNGAVREKITAGGPDAREMLWTGDAVWSIFPAQRLVVVEEADSAATPLVAGLRYSDQLENYYQMTTFARGSVANRDTQIVSVRAKDQYRYGYLVWLDRETALPLKMQVRNDEGRIIESLIFTEIELVDAIADAELESSIDYAGFMFKQPGSAESDMPRQEIWGATRLPSGFRLSISRESMIAGSELPVQHLVYTDGLAAVSVFIAHPETEPDIPRGLSRDGSRNAYSVRVNGRWATAIGDVPGRTVERIATSLDAQ